MEQLSPTDEISTQAASMHDGKLPDGSAGLLGAFLEAVHEPLLVLDGDLRVTAAGQAFYQVFQADPAAAVGAHLYDLSDGVWDIPALRGLLSSENASGSVQVEHNFPGIGRKVLQINARRLGTSTLLAFDDLTALQTSREMLSDTRERLEAALSAGQIATWTIDIANDRLTGDAHLARLFSVDPEATLTGTIPLQPFFDAIVDEDRAVAVTALSEALAQENDYGVECRVGQADGSYRRIASRGKVERAGGSIEQLRSTGSVVGCIEKALFSEGAVRLEPGDVVALFTDGLTEVGPSRKQLLDIEGLQALFDRVSADLPLSSALDEEEAAKTASLIVERLIAQVEAYVGGTAGLRDDIALLVGVMHRGGVGENADAQESVSVYKNKVQS